MRRSLLALLLISPAAPAYAQMQLGDILLTSYTNPELMVHFRPDGTVVQQSSGGTGIQWSGATILPNGDWVTTRRWPNVGINIFDGVTGAEIAAWDLPSAVFLAYDVAAFSDGTLAVTLHGGTVVHCDIAGNVINEWTVPSSLFGILVDDHDEVWTSHLNGGLWHTDAQGNFINEFSTGGGGGDVAMAQDGTLFVTRWLTGEVAHYAPDGTFLGEFMATGTLHTLGIAVGEDQTLWVADTNETLLRNFDYAGNLLGRFNMGSAGEPMSLYIPRTTGDFAANYCGPANPNSTGRSAVISARGSTVVAHNFFTLTASRLPPNVFSYFLNADAQGFTPTPPGSQGDLCLGGGIGRHNKQVGKSDAAGKLAVDLDLTALPRPGGAHSVIAGETWNFQCWYRDANPGPTSNFTDGVSVLFK